MPSYITDAMVGTNYSPEEYTPISEYRSLLIANDQSHMDNLSNNLLKDIRNRGVQIGATAGYGYFLVQLRQLVLIMPPSRVATSGISSSSCHRTRGELGDNGSRTGTRPSTAFCSHQKPPEVLFHNCGRRRFVTFVR